MTEPLPEDIERIKRRHSDLGKSTLHASGLAKIWINHYLNDVSVLLEAIRAMQRGDNQ